MKKTYMIPTVKVTELIENDPLCAASTLEIGSESQDGSNFGAKYNNFAFDEEYEEEEDY